jgi:CspA family cold shock protein
MATGKIARMVKDRGFGFIKSNDSTEDLFFHSTSVAAGNFEELSEGQDVEFQVEPDPRNPSRKRAAGVRLST